MVRYIQMPDVTNKTLKEAQQELKQFKIETEGEGDKIIYQLPEKDLYVKENSVVRLKLG